MGKLSTLLMLTTAPNIAYARGGDGYNSLLVVVLIILVAVFAYDQRLRANVGAFLFCMLVLMMPGIPTLIFFINGWTLLGCTGLVVTLALAYWMYRKE